MELGIRYTRTGARVSRNRNSWTGVQTSLLLLLPQHSPDLSGGGTAFWLWRIRSEASCDDPAIGGSPLEHSSAPGHWWQRWRAPWLRPGAADSEPGDA